LISPRRLDGRFWRIVSPRWTHDPLSGDGAARHGGRWNRPGTATLYLSYEVETAFAEYQQELGTRPGTFVAYEVTGATVFDLTDAETATRLGLVGQDLMAPWKELAFVRRLDPPGWLAADRLAGVADGLLVPSVQRSGGINLVLWRWNLGAGPTVTFHDPVSDLAL
jgi:RES domain-containing protein